MARTPAQRGAFGRWLTKVRTDRYERQIDALDAMRKLAGLHISQAEYSQWESGSRVPRADNPKVERLYEFFGSRPEEPAPAPERSDLAEVAAAIRGQTQAIGDLVARLDVRAPLAVIEAPGAYVDSATIRRRRAYWIERAVDEGKLNAESIAKRMDWPTSQLATVRRWLKGDIPDGATRASFAQAVMLPLAVLESPPATDHERLVEWRREALAEVPTEVRPAREIRRRSA